MLQVKKMLLAPVLILIALLLAGCSSAAKPTEKKSAYAVSEVENVSMRISDLTPTGARLIIKDLNETPYTYGAFYVLEIQKDGEWYELQTKTENYGFHDIGYLPDENGEVTFDMDWERLYGKLPEGQYRILKQVDQKYISTVFGWVES